MGTIASQITSLTIVYSTVYSDADQREHQSSASLPFVRGIHRFHAQMASNAENVSIWWRHHEWFDTKLAADHYSNQWWPSSITLHDVNMLQFQQIYRHLFEKIYFVTDDSFLHYMT